MTTVEIGTISSRGQIALPVSIRKKMGLEVGDKVLFLLENNQLFIKNPKLIAWEKYDRSMSEHFKKHNITQKTVDDAVRWAREQSSPTPTSSSQQKETKGIRGRRSGR